MEGLAVGQSLSSKGSKEELERQGRGLQTKGTVREKARSDRSLWGTLG